MKFILLGMLATFVTLAIFFGKGSRSRSSDGPGKWDKVYNRKELIG